MTRPRDPARPRSERPDLYATVTAQIIADLERGVRPWTRPWEAAHAAGPVSRPLRHTLEPYSGINVLLLWSRSMVSGFEAPIWMTFRQALSLGGHVRKGEHGETVVYANRITRTEDGPNGEDVERSIPFLKAYTVFNIGQMTVCRNASPDWSESLCRPNSGSPPPTPSSPRPGPTSGMAATAPSTARPSTR